MRVAVLGSSSVAVSGPRPRISVRREPEVRTSAVMCFSRASIPTLVAAIRARWRCARCGLRNRETRDHGNARIHVSVPFMPLPPTARPNLRNKKCFESAGDVKAGGAIGGALPRKGLSASLTWPQGSPLVLATAGAVRVAVWTMPSPPGQPGGSAPFVRSCDRVDVCRLCANMGLYRTARVRLGTMAASSQLGEVGDWRAGEPEVLGR